VSASPRDRVVSPPFVATRSALAPSRSKNTSHPPAEAGRHGQLGGMAEVTVQEPALVNRS
jgi:hypothetical protein